MTPLFIIIFFIILILADYLIRRRKAARIGAVTQQKPLVHGTSLAELRMPKGIFFHPGHAWVALQPEGGVQVGIDDFIQSLAEPIKQITPPDPGTEIRQGEPLLTIETDSRRFTIASPISGKISRVNHHMLKEQPLVTRVALDQEWVVDINPVLLAEELTCLSIAGQTREWFRQEMERLKDFLSNQALRPELAGITLQDGGEPAAGVVRMLDPEALEQFEREFLYAGDSPH